MIGTVLSLLFLVCGLFAVPNTAFTQPEATSSDHHLTMGEYQELAALLKKAERDNRLGEAMLFSGVAGAVQPALEKFQKSLNGGYIPIPLNLEAMLHAKPETPVIQTPKSASQRGRDALASMAASSSVAPEVPDGSWIVNARGGMVRKGEEQAPLHEAPVHDQFPVPPSQETPQEVRLRWKSKWDNRTGTARVIGFPAPDKTQQQPSQTENAQQNMQATTSTTTLPPQMMPPMNSIPENSMEVGRSKRGWESSDGSMHDGEFFGWDVVHEEVMSQLNNHGLVGPPFQRDAPPVDPGSWWWQR